MRFFTPGPTHLSDSVKPFIQHALEHDICSISHRSKEFEKIFARAADGVRALLKLPAGYQVFFLGSATEAWERIIQNGSKEHTFHVVNGAFSERFYSIAQELKRTAQALLLDPGTGADLKTIAVPAESELLCLTHNETSTGVALPEADVSALKRRFPEKLLAIDIVSSAPIADLAWADVDCGFFSVQKCFGLPAGLGVLIAGPAALAKAEQLSKEGVSTGSYHSFSSLVSFAKKNQTPDTPNVLGIYLLGCMTEEFLSRGIEKVRAETHAKAKRIYDFFSNASGKKLFVKDERYRSVTVMTVEIEGGAKETMARLAAKGFEVGSGYGKFKDSHIRIANFPMHSSADVEALLRNI